MSWTTKEYIIGIILFSAVIALFYLAVGDMATSYGRTDILDEDFSANYDKLSQNKDMAQDMLNATSNPSGMNIIGTADILISSTFSVINLVFGSLGVFKLQISHIGADFGIPTQVINIIGSVFLILITIGIILIIVNAVNKTEKL